MAGKQILIFSGFQDLKPILNDIEDKINVRYYRTGMTDTAKILNYRSAFDIPSLRLVKFGDWNWVETFLILREEDIIGVAEVPQRTGETKFAVDQSINRDSIEFKPGGILNNSTVLVAGRIATVSTEGFSGILYDMFASRIRKKFKKINSFYVGANAEEKLDAGWRLVTNERSPMEYDLRKIV